jgi:peptide/nickel transport system substrate-binding protein
MSSATKVFCCVVLCSLWLGWTSCARTQPPAENPQSGPIILTIGYPHITGENLHGLQAAARLISFEGLVSLGRDGRPQPRLAASWSLSPDGLAWTIRLRPNAFFHDGSPVDSIAVRQSLERSLGNADRDLAPGLADIMKIENPSDDTVVLHLQDRSTFALDDLSVAIAKIAKDGQQVGTGPFHITSSTNSQVTMTSVGRYYRGKPQIDQLVWKAYPTVRTAWAAMMRREIDFLYEVGEDAREFVEGEASTQVFPFLRNYVYSVSLNLKRPTFRDVRIRRALNHAVNRPAIVRQAFKGHGLTSSGSAWPEHWAFDSTVSDYSYDPSRASALLDAALHNAVISPRPGHSASRLHFTCIFPENFALWERMALLVQRDLAEIGVDMELEAVTVAEFNRRISAGDFDAVLIELIVGNAPSRPYTFWYSQSRRAFTGYNNTEVDAAFDGMRRAGNDLEYRQAFGAFQRALLQDPPAIFLALGEVSRAVSKRFQVNAPPQSDILPTIADWRVVAESPRMTN